MKVEKSKGDKLADIFCILLLISQMLYVLVSWGKFPDTIPAHYNAVGEIDRWGGKGEILIEPALSCLLYLFLRVAERYPQIWNTGVTVTEANRERVYGVLQHLLSTMKAETVFLFTVLTIKTVSGTALSVWFFPITMGMLFGSLFFWIWKLVKVK